ncbi:hypothetical protein C4D60_Mb10t19830 [Musa balbisiana]|uniref:Uncharacterized protein n=1 Tax=Musa balbisiana TaxID=52838 RepID=A0A4S8IYG7_MUSBA|nr:hypothetical protein C4D60_Mb10t19830 [Musa balbisiana]
MIQHEMVAPPAPAATAAPLSSSIGSDACNTHSKAFQDVLIFTEMPKIKTSHVRYPEGWELIEPTLRELEAKMREAENNPNDGECEALWPIVCIAHQKSCYIYDLYHQRKEISKKLYEFCLDQSYADHNLIAKWKKFITNSLLA